MTIRKEAKWQQEAAQLRPLRRSTSTSGSPVRGSIAFTAVFLLGLGIFSLDGYDLVIYGAAVPLLMKAFRMGPAQTGAIAGYALMGAALGSRALAPWRTKLAGRKPLFFVPLCSVSAWG